MAHPPKGVLIVVEDEETVRLLVSETLKDGCYAVEEAADGAEGLALVTRWRFVPSRDQRRHHARHERTCDGAASPIDHAERQGSVSLRVCRRFSSGERNH